MIAESRELLANYQKRFTRAYNYQYWIVVVNNHFEDCYSFFLYTKKVHTKLVRSYELVNFPNHDEKLYQQVLADFKAASNLSIEFRDTRHLVHPGTDILQDTVHGHGSSVAYREKEKRI